MASEIWSFGEKKKDELVSGLDYEVSKEIDFCESFIEVPFRNLVEKALSRAHSQ